MDDRKEENVCTEQSTEQRTEQHQQPHTRSAASGSGSTTNVSAEDGIQKYVLRYEGNQSAKWDGKEIVLPLSSVLPLVATQEELVPGKKVQLPWTKNTSWNAVIVKGTL